MWLPVADVLLMIEIISPGSEATDTVAKRIEYAGAGIPQYWTVDQDPAQTVTMYQLDVERYRARATTPLAWVLNTTPGEHSSANRVGHQPGCTRGRWAVPLGPTQRHGDPKGALDLSGPELHALINSTWYRANLDELLPVGLLS